MSKVEWKLLQQKVIMRHCLLKQDVPGTDLKAGETLDRISLVLTAKKWHARLYKNAHTKDCIDMFFHAAWFNNALHTTPQT